MRTKCHPHADLASALFDAVRDCSINPNARKQKRNASENSEKPHHQSRLAECLSHDRVHALGHCNRQSGVNLAQCRLSELCHRLGVQRAEYRDTSERKIFLGPGSIKLHARLFLDTLRANVADNADDLTRCAAARHQQCLAYWAFARKNFLCPGLSDQHDILALARVVLVELAPGEKWDSPRLEVVRRHIMTRRSRALLHRRQIAIAPRVERSVTAIQRNITTNGRGLDAGDIAQRVEQLFDETLTRCGVGILRSGQCDRAGPEVL